ncbi:MAG TPA: hypothetical protein PLA31_07460 [Clostridia bacterium]|nr:hypothetical protein [Candidatus Omnitrophota bacterium]HQO38798.1 hypothetical protein [Candidatus Omnitrophota bacterium]HUM61258.1 hypothetical protein [Clostridia bacterium]
MRQAIVVVVIAFLLLPCAYAADTAQSPATLSPTVTQVVGDKTDAKLGAALYPKFTDFIDSTDAACQAYLEKDFADGGLSLAPICTKSKYGSRNTGGKCLDQFVPVESLFIKNFAVPAGYRKSARLFITWTVRLEGYSKKYSVNPELCRNWYGTVSAQFPAGPVKTALYVNGKQIGADVSLEIPQAESVNIREVRPPSGGFDPTLVGTYVLTADDFPDKLLPASIGLIEIRWKNETAMDIVSPKGMRNMIINMVPVTKES